MTWDPELEDPAAARRRLLGADHLDVGDDAQREVLAEAEPAVRDAPPDPFAPIDPNAPVSGHVPYRPTGVAGTPEFDWSVASARVYPLLRPVGLTGTPIGDADRATLGAHATATHAQPVIDAGPEGLPIVFAMAADGFDIIINGDHLLSWDVDGSTVRATAFANLARWSEAAGWSEEADGQRRLISSASGDGWDASRILLADVRAQLSDKLREGGARVLVGLPERHLLVAGRLTGDDPEFATLFTDFVIEQAGGADEPIDRRVFELQGDRITAFAG